MPAKYTPANRTKNLIAFLHRLDARDVDAIYNFVLMTHEHDNTNDDVLKHIEDDCEQCQEKIIDANKHRAITLKISMPRKRRR